MRGLVFACVTLGLTIAACGQPDQHQISQPPPRPKDATGPGWECSTVLLFTSASAQYGTGQVAVGRGSMEAPQLALVPDGDPPEEFEIRIEVDDEVYLRRAAADNNRVSDIELDSELLGAFRAGSDVAVTIPLADGGSEKIEFSLAEWDFVEWCLEATIRP